MIFSDRIGDIQLFGYIFGASDFTKTFWWTGIVDLAWSILYIVVVLASPEIRLKDFSFRNGQTLEESENPIIFNRR